MHGFKGVLAGGLLALGAGLLGGCTTQETKPTETAEAGGIERELKECYLIGQMYLWSLDDFSQGRPLAEAQDTSRRSFFDEVPQLVEYQRSIAEVVYQERPQGNYPASSYVRSKYSQCAADTSDPELAKKSTVCFNLVLLSEVVHEMRDAGQTPEQVAQAFSQANQNLESYTPMIDAIYANGGSREDYNAGLYTRCLTAYVTPPAE
jgi:hypothetical protein